MTEKKQTGKLHIGANLEADLVLKLRRMRWECNTSMTALLFF